MQVRRKLINSTHGEKCATRNGFTIQIILLLNHMQVQPSTSRYTSLRAVKNSLAIGLTARLLNIMFKNCSERQVVIVGRFTRWRGRGRIGRTG